MSTVWTLHTLDFNHFFNEKNIEPNKINPNEPNKIPTNIP